MYRKKFSWAFLTSFCFFFGLNHANSQPVEITMQDSEESELSGKYSGYEGRLGNGDCACLKFEYRGGRVYVTNGRYTGPRQVPGGNWYDEEPPYFTYDDEKIDRTDAILSRTWLPDFEEPQLDQWLLDTLGYIERRSQANKS